MVTGVGGGDSVVSLACRVLDTVSTEFFDSGSSLLTSELSLASSCLIGDGGLTPDELGDSIVVLLDLVSSKFFCWRYFSTSENTKYVHMIQHFSQYTGNDS